MWSKLNFLLFVGLVYATNYAWLPENEYIYHVRSRALTSLDITDSYSGVFYTARLSIRTGNYNDIQEGLTAKLTNVAVNKVHNMSFPNGWESDIYFKYSTNLLITEKPFVILTKDNVISGLKVSAQMPTWESNLIKGIVSQLQMKIQKDSGCSYSVMEATITGEYETVYEFCGRGTPQQDREDKKTFYVTKTKNFEKSNKHPSFHIGLGDLKEGKPNANQMGNFFTKSSVSRAIIKGQLQRFSISSSETVNEISVSPTLTNEKRAVIVNKVNVTLEKRVYNHSPYPKPENAVTVFLVFEVYNPFSKNNTVTNQKNIKPISSNASVLSFESDEDDSLEEPLATQDPKLDFERAPSIPFIAEFIGDEGKSVTINEHIDFIKLVIERCNEIASDLENPENIPSRNTLSKYLAMIRVVATMDKTHLKQIERQVYTNEQGQRRVAWKVFRDIVGESATLPVYSILKDWIKEKKVESEEAALLFATIVETIATPTEQFARDVFEFTKDGEVSKQKYLNDTSILACASLMNRVYIDRNSTHNQYPIYVYGSFRTEHGKFMVVDEYIPYLTEQLKIAIREKDNHKMNVFIRALGNVGHKSIMESFDLFWSHDNAPLFQRVQSIIALNSVAKTYPTYTREVAFRIYNSEQLPQEMRIAAVYQIMRTNPSKAILQQMARQTNSQQNEYVNSAVQAALREAAECRIEECQELSRNAQAAVKFLTKDIYGNQYSKQYLRDFMTRNVEYMCKLETIGSIDSYIPQLIKAKFYGILGGLKKNIYDVEAVVSSVDDLFNFLQFRKKQPGEQESNRDNIIPKLNIPEIEPKQLQGILHYTFGNIETLLSFDNESVVARIEKLEEELKHKQFEMNKIINRGNIYLSAPLEIGALYTFSVDSPTYFAAKGHVTFEAQPSISNGNVKRFEIQSKAAVVVSGRLESRLTIITSFDHHEYASGFEKSWQVYLPLRVSSKSDLELNKHQIEVESIRQDSFKFFHYSSQPILGHRNILKMELITSRPDTYAIVSSPLYPHEETYLKQSGLPVRINYSSEHPLTYGHLLQNLYKHGIVGTFMSLLEGGEIDYSHYTIALNPNNESAARKIKLKFGQRAMMQHDLKQIEEKSGKSIDIHQTEDVELYYLTVDIKGQENVLYKFTGAIKHNVFITMKKESKSLEITPYQVVAWMKMVHPNIPELRMKSLFDMDLESNGEYFLCVGENCESKMEGPFRLSRSEGRKQYLAKQQDAAICLERSDLRQYQIPPCDNLTIQVGLFDQYNFKIVQQNSQDLVEVFEKAYEIARQLFNIERIPWFVKNLQGIKGQFSPDFISLNVTATSYGLRSSSNFIPVNEWLQRFIIIHPSYPVSIRLMGKYISSRTYIPACTIDIENIGTFDGSIYETYNLSQGDWYVALHYNQSFNLGPEGNQRTTYTLMIRKDFQSQSVKIIVMHPITRGQPITVELSPIAALQPMIKINGQERQWNETKSGQFEKIVTFYGNTKEEITVKVLDDVRVTYNTKIVKISVASDKMRGGLKGLCGTNDGLLNTDFTVPHGCLARTIEDFISSYKLPMKEAFRNSSVYCQNEENQTSEVIKGLRLTGSPNKNAKRSSKK